MYHMQQLHSQPELTYKMGLKNAESVKDTLHVLFFLSAADCSNQCMGNTEMEGVIFKAHRCY